MMIINDSIQPKLSNAKNLARFKGVYTLVGFVARLDKNDQPFWELTLSDYETSLKAYCFSDQNFFSELKPQQLVQVEVSKTEVRGQQFYRVVFAESAYSDALIANYGMYCLPAALCPIPCQLKKVIQCYESVDNVWLKQFLSRVLGDPFIASRFVSCPASLRHHHNFPGGLMVHSVDVAFNILSEPEISGLQKDIAIVAALLHDIGKVLTFTPDMRRTSLGQLADHSDLTLEVCAAPLRILDSIHPYAALQLRHAWTCASPNSRYGFKPKTLVARLLQVHDGNSAKVVSQNLLSAPTQLH